MKYAYLRAFQTVALVVFTALFGVVIARIEGLRKLHKSSRAFRRVSYSQKRWLMSADLRCWNFTDHTGSAHRSFCLSPVGSLHSNSFQALAAPIRPHGYDSNIRFH